MTSATAPVPRSDAREPASAAGRPPTRRPERVLRLTNRLTLVLGALLLTALAWCALTAAHSAGGPPGSLPSWWPGVSGSGALPGSGWWHTLRQRADPSTGEPLWQVLAAAVPALVLVVASVWLYRLAGPRVRRVLAVPGATGGDARLRGAALASAVSADIREVSGVRRARVTVHGRPGRPWLRLRVTLDPGAQPSVVLRELEEQVVVRARTSSGCADLRATVRLRVVAHRPNRVAESVARGGLSNRP
ncbi:alkaline shock response membrane anchor protein AmaP [Streptomyces sp. XM4193]|uniref:alkaline shock response membrane anchor protein AmaP n=1 Tax=Streptomyces sp. XM4193 TaxID=2929782 RepID=UPI001FF99D8D|nr:alkaline shock response membrane anchor protein AmaP [Streptomyces sp. XM4193]MCK1796011.1 alkaline shock response membrane anchor protein AmaP [Streptomyces sp. XM4193]